MDQGSSQEAIMPNKVTSSDSVLLKDATREDRRHQIHDFLERPVFIETLQWTTSTPAGQILKTYRFPDRLLSYVGNIAKTRGFYGFRAGVEFMVKVNRQPFQAGALMISFCPNARYNKSKAKQHLDSMRTRSGAPRIVINLKQDTEAVLKVPYSSPFVYYNLLNQEGNIGDFSISVYSPLSDVASTGTVPVSVFARFVNVDLQFPTGSAPSFFGPQAQRLAQVDKYYANPTDANFTALTEFVTQSNSDSIMNVKPRSLPHMTQPTTCNTSHVISLNSNSRLAPNSLHSASQSDEMSIASICSIPTYYDRFNWNDTDISGKQLLTLLVRPQPVRFNFNDGVVDADYVYALSEMFTLWHSSFVYTFRVISTPYHSGRLRVYFSPSTTNTELVDKNAMYTEIIDLKDATDFQFTVPWCHPYPYLNVKPPGPTSLGYMIVEVLNPLVNPTTVSGTIEIIVERNAGPDVSFQLPAALSLAPYNPLAKNPKKQQIQIVQAQRTPIAQPIAIQQPVPDPVQSHVIPQPPTTYSNRLSILSRSSHLSAENIKYITDHIGDFHENKIRLLDKYLTTNPAHNEAINWSIDQLRRAMQHHDLKKRDVDEVDGEFITQSNIDGAPSQDQARGGASHPYFVRPRKCIEADKNCLSLNTTHLTDLMKRASKFYEKKLIVPTVESPALLFTALSAPGVTSSFFSHPAIGSNKPYGTYTTLSPLPLSFAQTTEPFTSPTKLFIIPQGTSVNVSYAPNSAALVKAEGYVAGFIPYCRSTGPGNYSLELVNYYSAPFVNTVTVETTARVLGPGSLPAINLQPHFLGTGYTIEGTTKIGAVAVDNITYLSSLFTFYRGGVTLRYITQPTQFGISLDPTNKINVIGTSFNPLDVALAPLKPLDLFSLNNTITQCVNTNLEGFAETRHPSFGNVPMFSIDNNTTYDSNESLTNFNIPLTKVVIDLYSPTDKITIYRSADEDFNMSYLSGPPQLCKVTDPIN
jgi:hypothetical protein